MDRNLKLLSFAIQCSASRKGMKGVQRSSSEKNSGNHLTRHRFMGTEAGAISMARGSFTEEFGMSAGNKKMSQSKLGCPRRGATQDHKGGRRDFRIAHRRTSLLWFDGCRMARLLNNNFIIVSEACFTQHLSGETTNMPVMDGRRDGKRVSVLEDTGCWTVVVRESLISPHYFTEKSVFCLLIDGTLR